MPCLPQFFPSESFIREEHDCCSDKKYYCVTSGRIEGIYDNYADALSQVHSVTDSRQKSTRTYEQALAFWPVNIIPRGFNCGLYAGAPLWPLSTSRPIVPAEIRVALPTFLPHIRTCSPPPMLADQMHITYVHNQPHTRLRARIRTGGHVRRHPPSVSPPLPAPSFTHAHPTPHHAQEPQPRLLQQTKAPGEHSPSFHPVSGAINPRQVHSCAAGIESRLLQ
ncbi:hypothetical protein C8J57DRAFT_1530378 [Mycena rebaudengoi]|nr:hypothetical protein C8J57DRAFT_1530378 [Mycena rebaudengoi]